MNENNPPQAIHPMGESQLTINSSVSLDTFSGRLHVEWDKQAPVTALGQLPFFIDFLKIAELFEPWVEQCPLQYNSPNAPKKRDVLGTLFLSILSGHQRYAHITNIRSDNLNPQLLGMSKVVSEDSVRRAFAKVDAQQAAQWCLEHLKRCYLPLLMEPWILDVDTTVKVLYGKQEGAVVGYNPGKPGRPSQTYHTYSIGGLRLILDVEVQPGNHSAASYTRPALFDFIDSLPEDCRPQFLRADCAFGNEKVMRECETRDLPYLFKLRQTAKVRKLIDKLFWSSDWQDLEDGWQSAEAQLKLSGWSQSRRVVVMRRKIKNDIAVQSPADSAQLELAFMQTLEGASKFEYSVLITSLPHDANALFQLYRDRADSENQFDELKNHWGWGGFSTRDLKRCQIMARSTALIYNWWSLFARLAMPNKHSEAITSRPLLLHAIARQTQHGRQKKVTITHPHGKSEKVSQILSRLAAFFEFLKSSAEQFDRSERWRIILSRVFVKFLQGRLLGEKLAPELSG